MLPPHPSLQTSYSPSVHFISSPSAPSPPSLVPGCPSTPPLPPESLRVLQWNAGGLRARSTKLHFLSSHPVDLICIQESNLTRFPLSRFLDSLLCVLIASTLGLAFSLLMPRTLEAASSFSSGRASLSSLDPYSDYVGVNISLNNFSSLSFLIVYAPLPIRSSPTDDTTDFFSPSILPSSKNLFILGDFNCHHPLWDSRDTRISSFSSGRAYLSLNFLPPFFLRLIPTPIM